MTCCVDGCDKERTGVSTVCGRHAYLRFHYGSVDATPPKGRSHRDVMAFAARLGDEMRARKMGEMPVGSLGWMLAGDAAWRAAIGPNGGAVTGANTCTGDTLDPETSDPGDVVSAPGSGHSHLPQQEKAMGHLTPRATP